MKDKVKLIIVRHGQSIGNATRTILGHTDLDLTEHGYRQANATFDHLKHVKIDKIYSSDLKRAINTALPHAKYRDLEVFTSDKFREIYVGAWENQKVDDIIGKWGREIFENDWMMNFGTFRFPDGESTLEGGIRFYDELCRISKVNMGKTILIAAHAAVIRAFWGYISGISPEKLAIELPFPTNGSYSVAYYVNGEIVPDSYSNDSHLIDVGITAVILI